MGPAACANFFTAGVRALTFPAEFIVAFRALNMIASNGVAVKFVTLLAFFQLPCCFLPFNLNVQESLVFRFNVLVANMAKIFYMDFAGCTKHFSAKFAFEMVLNRVTEYALAVLGQTGRQSSSFQLVLSSFSAKFWR